MFPKPLFLVIAMALACSTLRCAPITTQFRMAEPLLAPADGHDAPYIAFARYNGKSHRGRYAQESVIALDPDQVRKANFSHGDTAYFAWDPTGAPVLDNRVNLARNSVYRLSLVLPQDYEQRRHALLNARAEALQRALDDAERGLTERNTNTLELLSEAARAKVIADAASYYELMDALKVDLVSTEDPAEQGRIRASISELAAKIRSKEAMLRADDAERDAFASLDIEETVIDQIQQWREEIADTRQQITALNLMVENPGKPFPRVVNGWMETMDITTFTKVGAVPFRIEDQYLDWIRNDKIVTVVFYDPNERPEDAAAALYRDTLPLYWPEGHLTVIEFSNAPAGIPRDPHAGARARSKVTSRMYRGVTARTYFGLAGEERTYLTAPDGDTVWVFGPDIQAPPNVEVWVENASGVPDQKLYPANTRTDTREASVMQIAGVEGGVLDPIREARKRGQIIAVAYLGNWQVPGDGVVLVSAP